MPYLRQGKERSLPSLNSIDILWHDRQSQDVVALCSSTNDAAVVHNNCFLALSFEVHRAEFVIELTLPHIVYTPFLFAGCCTYTVL
jgi:hypothetical protein